MKTNILITVITVIIAGLIATMQDPLLLAGGSSTGEQIVSPTHVSQWVAILIFYVVAITPIKWIPFDKRITVVGKTILLTLGISLVLASGHTYRYSDREHALVDTWFYIPVQSLFIDPNKYIDSAMYQAGNSFVSVYAEGQSRQWILSGPGPFGVDKTEVGKLLENYGFERKQTM